MKTNNYIQEGLKHNACESVSEWLQHLSDEYDTPLDKVKQLAQEQGPSELFHGLVDKLEKVEQHNDFPKAYERGVEKAESITIGSEFRGAMPEAEKFYKVDSPEYHVFITGYLTVLGKHEIYVDPNTGLVTRLVKKG